MTCTTAVREETFESLAPDWERLLAECRRSTFFDTPEWQRTWWASFSEGAALKLLSVPGDDGQLQFLAPFMLRDGTASFLGGTDLVDYHDFISASGADAACFDAIVRTISEDRAIRAVELFSIAEGSPTLERFPDTARGAGWVVEVAEEDVAPRLSLPSTWDEYVTNLTKKDRHELRRKMRRLEGAGDVQHHEISEPAEVAASMDDFMALHRMSTPDKAVFMTPEREAFFRDVSVRLAEREMTRLCFLELDGARLATSISFVYGGVKYLYNSGFDPEQRDLSVGLLNHAYNIRRSIEEGLQTFDFMRGNESYKYHLGGQDRRVYRVMARR